MTFAGRVRHFLRNRAAYTYKEIQHKQGYVAAKHYKNQTENATGDRVEPRVPRGMSGCPMLNSASLVKNKVQIRGVFTTYHSKLRILSGEKTSTLKILLDQI